MSTIFIGVFGSSQSHDVIKLQVDNESTAASLKAQLASALSRDVTGCDLIYKNTVLEETKSLRESLVTPFAYIHCIMKDSEVAQSSVAAEVAKETQPVHKIFQGITQVNMTEEERDAALEAIIAKCPEIAANLGAQAYLRDPVLFAALDQEEVIGNIAKHYPIICQSANLIVSTMREVRARDPNNSPEPGSSMTDSSSEEDIERELFVDLGNRPSTSNAYANANTNTNTNYISRQQLANALASMNSLANISQQSNDSAQTQAAVPIPVPVPAATTAVDTASTSAATVPEQMDTSEAAPSVGHPTSANEDILPADYRQHQYASQLRAMAHMGFFNAAQNIAFLAMTNGDIGAALDLLMASLS